MVKKRTKSDIPEIFPDKCIGCQACMGECPLAAIDLGPDGVAHINSELCVACGKCSDVCPVDAIKFERKRTKAPPEAKAPPAEKRASEYKGVAVFIEVEDGAGARVSWELTGKAVELAGKLNVKVIGFLPGSDVDAIAAEAIAMGCDEVYTIDHPNLENYLPATYGKAVSELCEAVKPEILLFGATHLGRDLAGVVATLLQTGLTADCTGLSVDEETGLLFMTRPTFGGNILATIFCERRRPQMSTVRPRVMRMPERDPDRRGQIHKFSWMPPESELPRIVDFIRETREAGHADIVASPALVVAGRGACETGSFEMLQELADLVGGTLACSRPVVESGLMPYERQVGQTGRTVAPRLYIGVGVSGAIQHLVAIQGAEKIVAINSDPNAPIFKVADVALLGNYQQIVPELISQLRERRKSAGLPD